MLYRVTATPSLRLRESAPYGRILANMPAGAIVRGEPTDNPAWLSVTYTPPNGLPIAGVAMTLHTALLPAFPLAFDFPVGTEEERAAAISTWPGAWTDATGYAKLYDLRGEKHFHTGADLNLNMPSWDSDRGLPVLSIAAGTVTYAGILSLSWGNTIVIRHDFPNGARCYSRYSALADGPGGHALAVATGDQVTRSQPIGAIGSHKPGEPHHLHFDISLTDVLAISPGDWPGPDWTRVVADYVDPLAFLRIHKAIPSTPDDGRPLDPTFAARLDDLDRTAEELASAAARHRQALAALKEFCL